MINTGTLKKAAKKKVSDNFKTAFMIGLIPIIITVFTSVNSTADIATQSGEIYQASYNSSGILPILLVIVMPAIVKMYLLFVKDKEANLSMLLNDLGDNFPRYLTTTLLTQLYTFFWLLLMIIPGFIKSYSYVLVPFLLADTDLSNNDAITESRRLMDGHKMEYFLLNLSFFGWQILSIFTVGILQIWLIPYQQTTYALYYQKLKELNGIA